MIVSASYRSDIPAFYGAWFLKRLAAGSCRMVNPYGGQVHEIDLTPDTVHALGRALGTAFRRAGATRVGVARDVRLSGERIRDDLEG